MKMLKAKYKKDTGFRDRPYYEFDCYYMQAISINNKPKAIILSEEGYFNCVDLMNVQIVENEENKTKSEDLRWKYCE